jgi:putative phosphoribosyl transferase
MHRFRDRRQAGGMLARELSRFAHDSSTVVLAIPRGGVPVASEIARALSVPLDVFLVRKLGVPGQEELAMGAIASGGTRFLNTDVVESFGIPATVIDAVAAAEKTELDQRERIYRAGRQRIPLSGKTVILVDDGLATGASMRVAIRALRLEGPRRIVVAVPVGAMETCASLRAETDELVCLQTPDPFGAVGNWYEQFGQTGDSEVRALLANQNAEQHVRIRCDGVELAGDLAVPAGAGGLVLFAHGSGSSRHSPRNRLVAEELNRAGFATLLMDLMTEDEERIAHLRFDIPLLARRLAGATEWAASNPQTRKLPVGYFGASTGAAAALVAAASHPEIRAIVSRGGRPDLAADALDRVQAPSLFLVGGNDAPVIEYNEEARLRMRVPAKIEIIPGATHLFEEPGALERVAERAVEWFRQYLR